MRFDSQSGGHVNFTSILVAEHDSIRTITLNRPERRNAMTPEMQQELLAAFEETAKSTARVLVLTGAEDAFCSGLDINVLKSMNSETGAEYRVNMERIARLFLALYELPIPTIAAVHGPAVAGGAGLATICDFTLATPEARFGFTEVRIGFVPALVSAFLEMQIGGKQARDLLLTGRIISAEEASCMGLVTEIVSYSKLAPRVQQLAETLIANSPKAMWLTKRLLASHWRPWLHSAIEEGLTASSEARETEDFREGVAAFLEKRKPAWSK
jgi:methylglutaconyl-CoA hydratase